MSVIIKCKTCSKEFTVIDSRKKTALYCSVKCKVSTDKYKDFGKRMVKHLKPWTTERRRLFSISKKNTRNPLWKGDKASLKAIHIWIRNRKPKPKFCVQCKKTPPHDLANISQKYLRDIKDFEWLCRRCHMKKDGRLKNFIEYKKHAK